MAKEEIDIQAERAKLYAKRDAQLEKERAEREADDERSSPIEDGRGNGVAVRATDGLPPGEPKRNPIEMAEAGQAGSGNADDTETKVKVSAAAKELADANGIDLSTVEGSGSGGSITKGDVQAAIDAKVSE